MRQLVLLRHGQSEWNRQNRFTGWKDVPLSEQGRAEADEAGRRMRDHDWGPGGSRSAAAATPPAAPRRPPGSPPPGRGREALRRSAAAARPSAAAAGDEPLRRPIPIFDVAYTSVLQRAIETLWRALARMELWWIPVHRTWRLNERHYGALTGLDKAETAAKHGEEQVLLWRRSYDVRPPAFVPGDPANPALDPRYAGSDLASVPLTESLKDCVERFMPCWDETIAPELRAGRRVLIAAHGNSLRALVKHLDGLSEEEVVGLNIPTGIPLVYELSDDLAPIRSFYLADEAELAAARKAVADQGKARA